MYGAAVPVTLCYFLLWNPPNGRVMSFFFLVAVSILVRTLITVYEIPSSALVAEMTDDYDERIAMTIVIFRLAGGTLMATVATLMLLVLLTKSVTVCLTLPATSLWDWWQRVSYLPRSQYLHSPTLDTQPKGAAAEASLSLVTIYKEILKP